MRDLISGDGAKLKNKMKWWQKKVRGWTVPFWYTDTPLYSKRVAMLTDKESSALANSIRESRNKIKE